MTQQSGGITPESICRQRGGGSVNDSGSGGFSGGHSSGGPSRLSDTDLHQVTQASHQTAHIIVQDTSSKSVSQASSSSEFPEKAHFQMAQQLQQFPILSEGSPGQAIQSMNNADPSSKSVNFPLRPGKGTFGVNCVVKAYRFFTELSVKDLYHYHVSITPDVTKSSLNRAVMEKLVSSYKYSHLGSLLPAYDGFESLYTAGPLPFASNEFEITLINDTGGAVSSRKEMKFTVMIGFASHTDPHNLGLFFKRKHADVPQKALEVLDIVMCQKPTSRCTPLKRSFSSLLERGAVDDELEAWSGSYQNIHPTEMCLSLNIDKSASVFAQPLEIIDFVAHILNRKISARPLSDSDHLKIKKALKGLKVEVTHQGNIHRKYRISGITSEPTRELTFSFGDSGTIKHVVQYFQETYGMKLKHTALPSLLVGNKQRRTYLPMEVCKISDGQRLTKILNVKKVENLVKLNYQRPHKREDDIIKLVKKNCYGKDGYTASFGNKINKNPALVNARILPAPRLKYHDTGSQKIFQPQGGWWSMMNKKMVNGGTVNSWTCINFECDVSAAIALEFCRALAEICCASGMAYNSKPILQPRNACPKQVDIALKALDKDAMAIPELHDKKLDLLIVILPDNNGFLYGEVKRICETEIGVVSQCCLAKNVRGMNKQYMANIALKINVKVGGRNTVLEDALLKCMPLVSDKPTIIFGVDVNHPGCADHWSPSIAAVVASQDWPVVMNYACLVSSQASGQEMVQDLFMEWEDPAGGKIYGGMIMEHLRSFYRANLKKPKRIIFYRDGVSEGQFRNVLKYELTAIQKAWGALDSMPAPPITYVVVQKHRNTRLFPLNNNDSNLVDKSGNILPGTVLDSEICHPIYFDFYLCSHASIQGAMRPVHYHVLWDENKCSADDIQVLTNNLCYIYTRCTHSVSYVAPTYYAHLAASRARFYLGSDGRSAAGGMVDSNDRGAQMIQAAGVTVRRLPPLCTNLKNVMFYC